MTALPLLSPNFSAINEGFINLQHNSFNLPGTPQSLQLPQQSLEEFQQKKLLLSLLSG